MIFSKYRSSDIILKIGINTLLSVVKQTKFLGMILDPKLTWLNHIQYV